jgi:hypothetical protein
VSRRLAAALVGALTAFALIAASLAPVAAASSRPSVVLGTNVDGTTARVTADINRAPHQIAICTYVIDGSAADSCGSATETGRKSARYTLTLTDLAVGTRLVKVTVVLTDRGSAVKTASFNVSRTDADGDGVPDATDDCPTIANPDQLDRYGSASGDACEDTDGDGTLDVDEADICISVDGVEVLSPTGSTATCFSDASVGGGPNTAVADGSAASAQAFDGHDNTAVAVGDDAVAQAFSGHGNTATAGSGSSAAAYGGNDNTATADGDGAIAAAFGGNDNSATASGDGAFAVAHDPIGCSVTNGVCP